MKILITGRSGFVGQALDHFLRTIPGVEIHGFNRRDGRNINNYDQLLQAVQGMDLVIHTAALANVAKSWTHALDYYETNVIGAIKVMEAARVHNVKLIHISTGHIYGNAQYEPIDENHPLAPFNPYVESKTFSDIAAQNRIKLGQDIVILRPFNLYGCGAFQTVEKLIPKLVSQALNNEDFTIRGTGESRGDFIFVDDVVSAIWAAKDAPSGAYNVCTGIATSSLEIAELVIEEVKKYVSTTSKLIHVPQPSFDPVRHFIGSHQKLTTAVGWQPKTTIKEGIAKSIQFYTTFKPIKPSYQ